MRSGFPRFSFGLACVLVAALVCCLPAVAAAQNSDEVHVVPNLASKVAQPPGAPPSASEATDASSALSQPAAPLGDEPALRIKPFRIDVDLVLVPVTVTDGGNHPITGLRKDDFTLLEDEQPQQIRYFSSEDAPLTLGVLVDLSNSMTNKIDLVREAVKAFFTTANPQDDYFVVTFADRPSILADTTQSLGAIEGQLAAMKPAGHTALLDAIYLGLRKAHQGTHRRRALLIISDGGDNHSRYHAHEIKDLVQESDVEIYAIGIFDGIFKTPEEWAGKRLLTQITEATGGRTLTLDNAARLPQVAAQISLELRNQYVLGYRPAHPARDGKWRKIKVRLTQAADAVRQVYSKRGYLAPGE